MGHNHEFASNLLSPTINRPVVSYILQRGQGGTKGGLFAGNLYQGTISKQKFGLFCKPTSDYDLRVLTDI